MDLQNKNVVYVGGYGGIGFPSCKCFLQHGVRTLAIFDVKEDAEKLRALQAVNGVSDVFFVKLDLRGKQSIEAAFAEAHAKMGTFDVVVNGSGIMNEQLVEEMIQINLTGVIHSIFTAMGYMDKCKGGNGGLIVNVSSVVSLDVYCGYAVYTATKYGVNGLTRALADPFYYGKTQIGFITICPSTTETPMVTEARKKPNMTFDHMPPPLPDFLRNSQSAEACGKNLVEAVKMAKNGSVWILNAGQLKEYQYPQLPADNF